MDRELRELERKAITGDYSAAIQLYYSQLRSNRRELIRSFPRAEVIFDRRNFNGELEFVAISAHEIAIAPKMRPSEVRAGMDTVPVMINRVPYSVRARYFYYDDIGWAAFEDNEITRAKELIKTLPPYDQRTWQDFLQITRSTLYMRRLDRPPSNNEPTLRAEQTALAMLNQIIPEWVEENLDLIRQGALIDTNNKIITAAAAYEEQAAILKKVENDLAELIINELRLNQ